MQKMPKGQTTVEFMVIVAMVLLILMGLFSTFYSFTPIGNNQDVLQSKVYWQSADFFVGGFYPSDGVLNITFQNNLLYNITLLNISFNSRLFAEPSVALTPGSRITLQNTFELNGSAEVEIWYTNDENGITYPFLGVKKIQFEK
jgi:hypothetical protein